MKAVITTSFFLLLFLQSHAQFSFTYFNEQFETVKERKAFYSTNQFFRQRGEETVVLTPMAGGEKLLVSFRDGKLLRKMPYQEEENTSFVKNFDSEGVSYHDKDTFFEVDESAIPLGGVAALKEFILRNLKYPPKAKRAGLEGVVFVQFVVTAAGEITEVRLVKGVHPLLNAEAVRLVLESGKKLKWIPGLIEGKPVSSVVVVPIPFVR